MKRLSLSLVALLVVLPAAPSDATCPPRLLTRLGTAAAAERDAIYRYWKNVPSGSQVEQGLVVALDLGEDAGSRQVANILGVFPASANHFERIARLRAVPGLKSEIAELGSAVRERLMGAAAEMRYADEIVGPSRIAQFQATIPNGRVPDIRDTLGDFHEVKFRDWEAVANMPPFLVEQILRRDVLPQLQDIQRYAASTGHMLTVAWEVPPPPTFKAAFDSAFAELRAEPNVVFIEGF